MKFKYAEQDLAVYGHNVNEDIINVKSKIAQEYEAFTQTLNDWAKLKEQEIQVKKLLWQKRFTRWMTNLKLNSSWLNSVFPIIVKH